MEPTYIILWVAFVLLVWVAIVYNRLIGLRTYREQSFADVDTQLKQRYDLVPQLISVVKWAKNFEEKTLLSIVEARSKAIWARTIDEKISADNALMGAMSGLFVVAESYPTLQSNQNFLQLQDELSDIENKLAASRRFFNSTTMEFNTSIQYFPNNLVAWMLGFKIWDFFKIAEEDKKAVNEAPKIEI